MKKLTKKLLSGLAKTVRPVRAPLKNLASIPLTIAGMACVSAAVFLLNPIGALILVGIFLFLLEHLIADED